MLSLHFDTRTSDRKTFPLMLQNSQQNQLKAIKTEPERNAHGFIDIIREYKLKTNPKLHTKT
jgi:hypothetical protein